MSVASSTPRGETPPQAAAQRRVWPIVALLLAAWVAYDFAVPPALALDARLAIAAIDQYRALVSPHLRGVVVCRFEPTCSLYGRQSIARRGLLAGGVRTAIRLARCGPWTPEHTIDPP
jgi:Uncharacterized conserved protein